jgi:hypothetical protein
MSEAQQSTRTSIALLAALLALSVAGCGVPRSMQYAAGTEPNYEDDDVRFRTVYYFRVFDFCDRPESGLAANQSDAAGTAVPSPFAIRTPVHIQKDSLYRFRMTGKASSLFTQVHFESGTLKAHQIDPLGADVAFDENGRRFYIRSAEDTQAAARFAADRARIDDLRKLVEDLGANHDARADALGVLRSHIRALDTGVPPPAGIAEAALAAYRVGFDAAGKVGDTVAPAAQRTAFDADVQSAKIGALELVLRMRIDLDARIVTAEEEIGKLEKAAQAADVAAKAAPAEAAKKEAAVEAAKTLAEKTASLARARSARAVLARLFQAGGPAQAAPATPQSGECPPGARFRRGFQILGPEGLRTFDPEDRLLMAMSTDGKPLISMLQEISGRILDPKLSPEAIRLPVAEERLVLLQARRVLDAERSDDPEKAAALVQRVIDALKDSGEGAAR